MKKRLWLCNLIANHRLAQRSLKAANNANAATVQMATGAAVEATQGEETANATNVLIAKRTVAIQIWTKRKDASTTNSGMAGAQGTSLRNWTKFTQAMGDVKDASDDESE
jgi:hypothetical protein